MTSNVAELLTIVKADFKEFNHAIEEGQAKVEAFSEKSSSKFSAMGINLGVAAAAGLAVFGTAIVEANEKVNQLYLTSRKLGLNIGDYQQLGFAAKETGVSIESLDMVLKNMSKTIGQAEQGNAEAISSLGMLGLTTKDLVGKSEVEQLELMSKHLNSIGDSGLRAAAGSANFKRSFLDVIAMSKGEGGIAGGVEKAQSLGVGLTPEQGEQAHALAEKLEEFGASLESTGLKLASDFAPAITNLLTWLEKLGGGIKDTVNYIENDLRGLAARIARHFAPSDIGQDETLISSLERHAPISFLRDGGPLQNVYKALGVGDTDSNDDYDPNSHNKGSSKGKTSLTAFNSPISSIQKLGDAAEAASTKLSSIKSMIDSSKDSSEFVKQLIGDKIAIPKGSLGNSNSKSGIDQQNWVQNYRDTFDNIQKGGDKDSINRQIQRLTRDSNGDKADLGAVNDLKKFQKEQSGEEQPIELKIQVSATEGATLKILESQTGRRVITNIIGNSFSDAASGQGK